MTQTRVWTLGPLAEQLGARLEGDSRCRINSLNTLQKAGPDELTFLANPAYEKYLSQTSAAAVILKPSQAAAFDGNKLLVDNPYLAFAYLTQLFDTRPQPEPSVHPTAWIDPQARLAPDVSVGPHASIAAGVEVAEGVIIGAGCSVGENCRIGPGTRLFANVTLYHGVTLGSHVTLHSSCVIGADGFGFAPSREGWVKVHQLGGVVIGNRVEVGAGTTIDRGALDDTVIGDGVIIDNQVQIAHNVRIGENTAIAGCTGIAGSTTIGRNCTIAGAASIAGHLQLVDGVHISARTLVTKSINEPGSYSSGTVMAPTQTWRRNVVRFGQLDQMASRLTALEKRVASNTEDKQ